MKIYKLRSRTVRRKLKMTIKELAEKLNCRRESIYYALGKGREKSEIRKKIDKLLEEADKRIYQS